MRISSVETFPVEIPLRKPIKMSNVVLTHCRNVVVRITTDEGVTGWGEGVEAMPLTGENQARIKAAIDELGERLIGRDPLQLTRLWLDLAVNVHGNQTAIGALDIALHDLAGRALGVPVSQLIGGASRDVIPTLTLLGNGDTKSDLEDFGERYEAGYRWFKLKLGIADLATEVATLEELSTTRDDTVVCGDVNAGWDEHTSARFLRAVDGLPVRFVEQPVAGRRALVRLAATSPVAICADEHADSLEAVAAFGATAIAGVSLKLIKLGGITGVMRGAALCDTLGLNINLSGKIAETSIAAAANVHCAAAMSDFAYGCSPGNQGNAADVTEAPLAVVDGAIPVPTGPGLGIEVDEALVRALA